jgi:hypothetical protein
MCDAGAAVSARSNGAALAITVDSRRPGFGVQRSIRRVGRLRP